MPTHRKLYICQSTPQNVSGAQRYVEETLGSTSDETDKANRRACGRRRRSSSTRSNICRYQNALFYPICRYDTGSRVTEGCVEV